MGLKTIRFYLNKSYLCCANTTQCIVVVVQVARFHQLLNRIEASAKFFIKRCLNGLSGAEIDLWPLARFQQQNDAFQSYSYQRPRQLKILFQPETDFNLNGVLAVFKWTIGGLFLKDFCLSTINTKYKFCLKFR